MKDPEHLGGYVVGGDSHSYTPWLWEMLLDRFNPKTLLDVGCGEGHSTRWFLDHGVDAVGVEGSRVALATTKLPLGQFVLHDFTSGPPPIPLWYREFDMIWCCEFVEHVEERYLPNILATLAQGHVVAMTAALPWQKGFHHVNNHELDYWIGHMRRIGFKLDEVFTERTKKVETELLNGTYWAYSGMVFTR